MTLRGTLSKMFSKQRGSFLVWLQHFTIEDCLHQNRLLFIQHSLFVFTLLQDLGQCYSITPCLKAKMLKYILGDQLNTLVVVLFSYLYLANHQFLELLLVLLIVIEDCLDLREGLRSLKLIYFVCKLISSHIVLESQLQLGDDSFMQCDFEGNV